jgi:thymidylate synthase
MNKLDLDYQNLLRDILENGTKKETRNGGTISVFGRQLRHDFRDGFPLLTTKRMAFKAIVTELLWFLRGDTNIKYLVDNNCHIWDGDAYKNFEKRYYKEIFNYETGSHNRLMSLDEFILNIKTNDEFANKWGDLGPIYGKQWRSWEGVIKKQLTSISYEMNWGSLDQITNLINDLKTNPDSRRLMVNAWNVGELDQMVLPPCHYGFQVYTRKLSPIEIVEQAKKDGLWRNEIPEGMTLSELQKDFKTRAISLMWNQRSVDTFLGLPFNIASYGLLLTILAKKVNMVPDQLIGNLGDTHLYLNHIEQAKEQIGRDLTDEERYDKWFNNNYETGMEKFFDPNNLPDFDNKWFEPTPKRTREPFELPQLEHMKTDEFYKSLCEDLNLITHLDPTDFTLKNYQSHPSIKAPLSN